MNLSPPNTATIDALAQQAEQALTTGDRARADALMQQVRAVDPEHPAALNAAAMLALQRGDAAAAHGLLERAVVRGAGNTRYWMNLAGTLRHLGRSDAEIAALDKVLAMEPRHTLALLQKGVVLEMQGKRKAAAKVFNNGLQTIPAGTQVPGSLRGLVEKAAEAVRANDAALDNFLQRRLHSARQQHESADLSRFDHCIDALLGRRRIFTPQPNFLHFPKLPAWEFHPRRDFPWLGQLEAASGEIRAEFERIFAQDNAGLEPYIAYPDGVPLDQWAALNHSRRWSAFYLWRDGKPVEEHLQRCPRTAQLLRELPQVDIPGYAPAAFFSILDARSRIPPHTGVTNTRLIAHLPLVIPPGCGFRVGSETRQWRYGQAWVFDDTIEHEAWNDSDVPRAVLIFDVWNPQLTDAERDLVRRAVQSVKEYYRDETALDASF